MSVTFGDKDTPIGLKMSDDMKENKTDDIIYGATGILNSGNTCYMNSSIQVFAHLPPITNYLLQNEEIIMKKLLINFPRVHRNTDKFNLEKNYVGIPSELKQIINSPEYNINNLTNEQQTVLLNCTMTYQLLRLIKQIWTENCTISPVAFRTIFSEARNKFFFGNDQHDAEEAYSCILQQIIEEIGEKAAIKFSVTDEKVVEYNNKKSALIKSVNAESTPEEKAELSKKIIELKKSFPRETLLCDAYREMQKVYGTLYSDIFAHMTGMLYSSTNCPNLECGYHSNKFDAYAHLSLPISSKSRTVSIYDCLDEFTSDEKLDNNNLWNCDGCKQKVAAVKKLKLWINPPVLVIHLKRFNHAGGKNTTMVDYPITKLDISKYIDENKKASDKKTEYTYTLQSVIVHSGGGLNSGHYYTYSRYIPSNDWLEFNDDDVSTIDESKVVTRNAYLLVYMRNDFFSKE